MTLADGRDLHPDASIGDAAPTVKPAAELAPARKTIAHAQKLWDDYRRP